MTTEGLPMRKQIEEIKKADERRQIKKAKELERQRFVNQSKKTKKESEKTVFIIATKQAMNSGKLPEFLWNCLSQKADKDHKHPPPLSLRKF